MARICEVTRKKTISGNNKSHAMNKTKRKFLTNINYHRFWIHSKKKFISLRVSSKGIRIINKQGIETVLNKIKLNKKLKK
ncbi:MAG: 50S ribosomal protein L28 [Candidatus Makana argininalis]